MICGDNMTEVTLEFANERLERLTDALRFGMATVYATQEQIDAEIAQLDLKKTDLIHIQGAINEMSMIKLQLETTEDKTGDT